MRGILKGSAFTVILMDIIISVISVVNIYTDIPSPVLKGVLWVLLGLCTFLGSMPVARSAESSGLLKGIASSILSIFVASVIISVIAGGIPSGTSFYVFLIICLICGLLGSFTGTKTP